MEQLNRITQNPAVMGGKACIRGMRVTVGMIVGQVGAGHSIDEILASYPYLEREDIMQALRYAAWLAEEREVVIAAARNGNNVGQIGRDRSGRQRGAVVIISQGQNGSVIAQSDAVIRGCSNGDDVGPVRRNRRLAVSIVAPANHRSIRAQGEEVHAPGSDSDDVGGVRLDRVLSIAV